MKFFIFHCACDWQTVSQAAPPEKCAACGSDATDGPVKNGTHWINDSDHAPAEIAAMQADQTSKRIAEHATKHGYMLYQISKNRNRWVCFKLDLYHSSIFTVGFGDSHKVSYRLLEPVHGPVDRKSMMTWLRANTEPLPDYLK